MKKTILILLVFIFSLSIFGQIEKHSLDNSNSFSSQEKPILQTNTDFVLVGEYVYYKLFTVTNNSLSTVSKIGYVELVNAKKEVVLSHKLKLNNGVGYSDFFIPSKVMTGLYKLIGYTNFSKNNPNESYVVKDLFIINPFTANTQEVENRLESTVKISKKEHLDITSISHPQLSISTQKKKYTKRELIQINIDNNETIKNGNYSLSIRKLDSIKTISTNTKTYISENNSELFFIPELRGELISGQLTNKTNALDIADKHIALSIPGEHGTIKVSQSNSKGQFFFNLYEDYTEQNAIFQVMEDNYEDFKIEIDSVEANNYSALQFADLKIDSNLKTSIEDRNIQNQIENAYYENKQDSIIISSNKELFYDGLAVIHQLDDYTRFKTVRETFIEVVNQAGLRSGKDNDYKFVVYDNVLNYDLISNDLDPLVLVDGIVLKNNSDLVFYNPKKIKSIAVVQGQYVYGSKLFQGVIEVSTFSQDFKTSIKSEFLNKTLLKKLEAPKVYYQPNYAIVEELNNRIPDYRRQLLWVPVISNTLTTYTAFASDVKGIFEVKLEGINNLGSFISTSTFIEVK
ncbi:hypothetical protein [Mesoflavibacter zeaxanthinifaciens]|uniref:hypothetical protein n=1 Tax=Mesoflavibacter zeaxanthinifaciens TaxID=393060 RepID=UPI003A8E37DD